MKNQNLIPANLLVLLRPIVFFTFCFLLSTEGSAQWVLINQDGGQPDSSAAFEVRDTTRGFLLPRLTQVQINAISNPTAGLMVFNSDSAAFSYYDGSSWSILDGGTGASGGISSVLATDKDAQADSIVNLGAVSIGTAFSFGRLFVYDTTNTVLASFVSDSNSLTSQIALRGASIGNSTTTSVIGLRGEAHGNASQSIAVSGNNAAAAGIRLGVLGQITGSGSTGYGVYGEATGSGTSNIGVYGSASGATNNYSGYFTTGKLISLDSVGIFTTAPAYTLDVNGHTGTRDLTINGQYTFANSDGALGEALVTDGAGTLSWDLPNDKHWTQGTGVIYNNSADQLVVGNTTASASVKMEVETPSSTAYQTGIQVDNNFTGTNAASAFTSNLNGTGTGGKYGLDNSITGQVTQSGSNMGVRSVINPAGTHWSYGVFS